MQYAKRQFKISAQRKTKWRKIMGDKDTGSGAYNIVAFCFDGQDTAKQTLKAAKDAGVMDGYDVIVQAIVEQDEKGKVHIQEPGRGGVGTTVGAVAGGILGLIGGPAGLLAWTVGGAVIGGVAGKYLGRPIAKGDLREIGEALSPDSSALLMLLEDVYAEAAADSMSGYNAQVVTLTVGDELSGEIAQFAAGAVSDDEGNVVAGVGGVAADAEGDVVAGADVAAATTD
jgi:uncharacterized membrane protein